MNLRIITLTFKEGIGPLGGRQSIASEATPGLPVAERIERVAGGYLIGWAGALYVVPDSVVVCAKVRDEDAPKTAEQRAIEEAAALRVDALTELARQAPAKPPVPVVADLSTAEPGSIVMNPLGQYVRVPQRPVDPPPPVVEEKRGPGRPRKDGN